MSELDYSESMQFLYTILVAHPSFTKLKWMHYHRNSQSSRIELQFYSWRLACTLVLNWLSLDYHVDRLLLYTHSLCCSLCLDHARVSLYWDGAHIGWTSDYNSTYQSRIITTLRVRRAIQQPITDLVLYFIVQLHGYNRRRRADAGCAMRISVYCAAAYRTISLNV